MYKNTLIAFLSLVFMLTACAPAAATQIDMMDHPTEVMEIATEIMMEEPSVAMATVEATATPEAMMEEKMVETPTWFGVTLTNVRSGEDFTISDFKGRVVLVETLAMWCPKCKQQQMEVMALHEALGMNEEFVSVGLDIDHNENGADLKTYTEKNAFDWIYAIAPAEVSREIGNLYGDQFLNPTSTPMLLISREGEVHLLPFGIKSADELMEYIEPFLKDTM